MRKWWKRITSDEGGVVRARAEGTYVMNAEWQRTEELRPERLGPDEYDVMPVDPERPSRTLGDWRKH